MRFDKAIIKRWQDRVNEYLMLTSGVTSEAIYEGAMAWNVAHKCGITEEAYADRSVVDAHIVTALRQIFPNAVFKNKYHY